MGARYRFVCPTCAEEIAIDAPMREALVDHGCVVCGASVTAEAFDGADDGGESAPTETGDAESRATRPRRPADR